jgi:hypothetical protein
MAIRSRSAVSLVLGAALAFSLGIASSGASVKAGGKVASASLSSTSFTAAQAKTVKLAYKISPRSKHFAYLLSLKQGAKWVKVRSVSKTGSFKGSHKMTVNALFGSKSVSVGQYRIKLSADSNSLSRKFSVTKASTPSTPSTPDTVQPKAGFWLGSGSDTVITYVIGFTVTSGGTSVTNFQVTFDDPGCGIAGAIVTGVGPYSITSSSFSSGRGNPTFGGTFSSKTTATGTSRVTGYSSDDCGDNEYETANWTASWHSAS